MTHHLYIFLCYLLKFFFPICDGEYNINSISNNLNEIDRTVQLARSDLIDLLLKVDPVDEKVSIRVYYQCYCPHCIRFETTSFASVVRTLHNYLDIETYPYGKAKVINIYITSFPSAIPKVDQRSGESCEKPPDMGNAGSIDMEIFGGSLYPAVETIVHNGTYEFICPNGPLECYGNKLHACALDLIQNKTEALLFNSCMMMPRNNSRGSDDVAADICAKEFNVDAASIEECAKGSKGDQLLKYYGDESKKVSYKHVPFILINGEVSEWVNFQKDVCSAFANPPHPCQELGLNEDATPA